MKDSKEWQEQRRRLKWVIGIRLVLVSLILGVGSFVLQVDRVAFYILVGFLNTISFAYLLLLRTPIPLLWQAALQLGIDFLALMGILHFSGGVDSIFIPLLLFPLIGAGVLLPWKGCALFTVWASLVYLTFILLENQAFIPFYPSASFPRWKFVELGYITAFRLFIFWCIAALSAELSYKLKMQAKAFHKLKNLHDIILDHINNGIMTVNDRNEIVYTNDMAQKLMGCTSNELLGQNWKKYFIFPAYNSNLDGDPFFGEFHGSEVSLKRKDNSTLPVDLEVTPIQDEHNRYYGKVMIFRDLTRIKELGRKKQEAERLAAIGELAAGIAHEIRSPLASISGSIEVLLRKKMFDVQHSHLVDILVRETRRLNSIVDNFLNYTRRPELEKRWMDLDQVLEEVMLLLRHSGKWKSQIEMRKVNHIPGQTRFWFDPNQMKEIFYNLLLNASESMSQEGEVVIELSDAMEGVPHVKVQITDRGCGIPKEFIAKIFKPFFTTKQSGTGMGLPIVHRIVQDHGGWIEVKSEEGKGSTFILHFPRGEEIRRAA